MRNKNSNIKFWYENPDILFKNTKLSRFFPFPRMSENEKLNSITRLSFYISVIMYIYTGNYLYLFVFIITIIFTFLIYKTKSNIKNSIDNFKNYQQKYIYPTKNNPFMNVMLDDYNDTNREAIIKTNLIDDTDLDNTINKKFNINLYKDLNDIFEKENSQRQFYTTPITTIPNNQIKFAKWLYKSPPTCKENYGTKCYINNYNPLSIGSRIK